VRRYWKALYLDGFSDDAIATTVDWSNRRPSNDTLVIVRHCGGAMARVAPEETAFGDRSSEWMLSVDSSWLERGDDTANIAYTRAFWDAATPFSDGKTYFNFPGLLEEGDAAVRASYGANHARLARSRRRTTRTTCSGSTRTSGRRPERPPSPVSTASVDRHATKDRSAVTPRPAAHPERPGAAVDPPAGA
jgi:hypothetical protein